MAASVKEATIKVKAGAAPVPADWHYLKLSGTLLAASLVLLFPVSFVAHLVFGTPWFGWKINLIVVAVVGIVIPVFGKSRSLVRWNQDRIQTLANGGIPAPDVATLVKQRKEEQEKIALARQAWATGCNTPDLQGKKAGEDKKTILPLLDVHCDANMAVKARVLIAGGNGVTDDKIFLHQDTFKNLTPGCVAFEPVRLNGTGHALSLTWHFKEKFDGTLALTDVPDSPKGTLAYGIHPDGTAAFIRQSESCFFFGLTRAGKSNMNRALMADALKKGVPVNYHIADLKAKGLQMAKFGEQVGRQHGPMKISSYVTTADEAKVTLANMIEMMNARAERMKKRGETVHVPTTEEPLEIFLADETLPLKEVLKAGFQSDLGEIAFSGAALGFVIWANIQLTDKGATGDLRDLVPQSFCFRVKTRAQMEAALGDGAAAGGARCHLNPPSGVGWTSSDSSSGWDEFRAAFVPDDQAAGLALGELPAGVGAGVQTPERKCCVYDLFDFEGCSAYVGQGWSYNDRREEHMKKAWWPEIDESRTQIYWRNTKAEAVFLEEQLIRERRPRYNTQKNMDNPTRNDWKRDYQPRTPSLPQGILDLEVARQTRRGRAASAVRSLRPKKVKEIVVEVLDEEVVEPVGIVEEGTFQGSLEPETISTSLRSARQRSSRVA